VGRRRSTGGREGHNQIDEDLRRVREAAREKAESARTFAQDARGDTGNSTTASALAESNLNPTIPAVPGRHLGPYVLEDLIGSGGIGLVYRARDQVRRRRCNASSNGAFVRTASRDIHQLMRSAMLWMRVLRSSASPPNRHKILPADVTQSRTDGVGFKSQKGCPMKRIARKQQTLVGGEPARVTHFGMLAAAMPSVLARLRPMDATSAGVRRFLMTLPDLTQPDHSGRDRNAVRGVDDPPLLRQAKS
jgi:hypothetical protein